jgi:hypothetical protein
MGGGVGQEQDQTKCNTTVAIFTHHTIASHIARRIIDRPPLLQQHFLQDITTHVILQSATYLDAIELGSELLLCRLLLLKHLLHGCQAVRVLHHLEDSGLSENQGDI